MEWNGMEGEGEVWCGVVGIGLAGMGLLGQCCELPGMIRLACVSKYKHNKNARNDAS